MASNGVNGYLGSGQDLERWLPTLQAWMEFLLETPGFNGWVLRMPTMVGSCYRNTLEVSIDVCWPFCFFLCGPKDKCLQWECEVILKNFSFHFKGNFCNTTRGTPLCLWEKSRVSHLLARNTPYKGLWTWSFWKMMIIIFGFIFRFQSHWFWGGNTSFVAPCECKKSTQTSSPHNGWNLSEFESRKFVQMIQFDTIWLEVFFWGVDPIWSQLQL